MPQICKLVYAIKNSSTVALPQWFCILEDLSLEAQVMPCHEYQFLLTHYDSFHYILATGQMTL